jgi:putative FmdB family regulatory protein
MASRQCSSSVDVARPVGVASPPPEVGKSEQEKELGMPRYEFLCEKCQKPFELTMTISEHEKGNVRCPTCKSTRVTPQFGGFMAQTKKKS